MACVPLASGFPNGTNRVAGVLICNDRVNMAAGVSAPPEAVYTDTVFGTKSTTTCGKSYLRVICDPAVDQAGADSIVQKCR